MENFRGRLQRRMQELVNDQSGAIAVYAAIAMVAFLACGTLAVDIAHLVAVKGELQKAADAGALAGARALALGTPFPNWTNGAAVADATTKKNKVDGQLVTSCQVESGYWSLSWNESTAPEHLQSQTITPTALDRAAVKVAVQKGRDASGTSMNGGPVSLLFGHILGGLVDPSAKASAVVVIDSTLLPVTSCPPGEAFPLASPITYVMRYCNQNPPVSFKIGSKYHTPDGGQWTSFLTDANDVPTIRSLINNGNPTPIKIGDQIYIQPGTMDTLYADAADKIGDTVLLPVVADDFETHDHTAILGFVPFYIENAVGGADKYIQGHFVKDYQAPGAAGAPGAPNYGALGKFDTVKMVN